MSSSPTLNFHSDGTLFIVSGPSGSGKTTLINRAREQLESIGIHLHFSVSHTTRAPRAGEREGVDYYFVDRPEFEQMTRRREFIEWASVHGNQYGTSKREVQTRLDHGEDVILDIDVQGARQIAENPELSQRSVSIFVFPPSFQELELRIRERKTNTEEDIAIRLEKAAAEIEEGFSFYNYVIINDHLDIAVECLKATIVAKKIKTNAALTALQSMARQFKEDRIGRTTTGR
jgi:guanylate kinase